MSLSGQLQEKLQDALIDAFPRKSSIEQLLWFQLEKNLNVITGEGSLQDMVFELIQTANSQGWVEDLVCAAYNSNPGNSKLSIFVENVIIQDDEQISTTIKKILEKEGYLIRKKIGVGNSCVTYLASRKRDRYPIVVKTLKSELIYNIITSKNQESLDNFVRGVKYCQKEAKLLLNFKHPNIVKYYQHFKQKCKMLINGSSDNCCLVRELELVFLVMEYIEGKNLEELVSKRGSPLEEAEALSYIRQIGEALTVVHGTYVLHRDIKPQNIMVREATKEAVLIDFGIAREFNPNVTQTHTVSFTQGYAPPEQLNPKAKRGNYTDIYGLAATLYYLLTQEHPIHALYRTAQLLDEPKKLNFNISDRVNEAILWAMELEPSNRPQTIQQWLAKLSLQTPIELKPPQEVLTQSSILEPAPSNNLSSDCGVDYTRLRDLLEAGQWFEADQETLAVMFKVSGREKEGYLTTESIDHFPCTDLRTIDQLWVRYSNGRFGFSVQKRIWESVSRDYDKFSARVGWRKISYSQVTFNIRAPQGHLPVVRLLQGGHPQGRLFSRVETCSCSVVVE